LPDVAVAAEVVHRASTGASTSATVAPFKGPFSSGTVTLKDANGNLVTLLSGGTINASCVAPVSYSANVTYPLIIEVTGSYYNEVTGLAETTTVPLRGIITSATTVLANSTVPVTLVTETAVADLQNRLVAFSPTTPVTTTSAVAALNTAGTLLGIPASTVAVFDPVTHLTSDANTLRLAALAVVANAQTGATLTDKAKALAIKLAQLGVNAPTTVITQAAYDSALLSVTTGALSLLPAGSVAPTSAIISTVSYSTTWGANSPALLAMVWDQPQATWDNVNWQ
jgi:hypothetical protein